MATADMHGKAVLIAGGTKGIGRAVAVGLAQRGADVTVVGRDTRAGEATVQTLRGVGSTAAFMSADLSLMSEVRRVAHLFRQTHAHLDVLVQCADVIALQRRTTSEGWDVAFALNYLGRFLLTNLLLDLLRASPAGRIVHVAAPGLRTILTLEQVPPGPHVSSFRAHNLGQKANDVFAIELAQRLAGSHVTINVINPGFVATDIRRKASKWFAVVEFVARPITKTPAQVAQQVITLLTAPEFATSNGGLFTSTLKPVKVRPDVQDPHLRQGLWDMSARLTALDAPTPTQMVE